MMPSQNDGVARPALVNTASCFSPSTVAVADVVLRVAHFPIHGAIGVEDVRQREHPLCVLEFGRAQVEIERAATQAPGAGTRT